ncbi:glucooligosaccharide oxidase [Tricholoma matsutake]|nr:glucooligosaccharide oxidase [Tricholoma matsutake 945]
MIGIRILFVITLSFALVFADNLRGKLTSAGISAVFPGDSGYGNASTPFNLRFSFQPAAVTFPKTPEDISNIIKIGASSGLQIVARGGGHSYIANGLGGRNGSLVVDLRNFKGITVNPSNGTALIESGNRLGDIALTLNDAGRALPHGTCPYVGIGGHSSYGGFGFTSRMWGLTLDNVICINMVLANGTIVTASQNENSDLFWAMRGSGGSFGITTSIEVTTHPAPPSVTAFFYNWDLSVADAASWIAKFQTFVQTDISPEFGAYVNLNKGSASGRVALSLNGGWFGPAVGLNTTIAPFLSQIPTSPQTILDVGTYIDSVGVFGRATGSPSVNTSVVPDSHDTFYAKSLMTPESSPMSTSAITAFMNYLGNEGFSSTMQWFCEIELYGGKNSAVNAVAQDATAFAHRQSTFTIQFYASSSNKQPPFPQGGFSFLDGMVNSILSNSPSNWNYGAYPNYIDDKLVDWQLRYYGTHYDRLRSIKDKYDPHDTFNFPTAIQE